MHPLNNHQSPASVTTSPADPLIDALEARLLPRLNAKLADLLVDFVVKQNAAQPLKKRLLSLRDLARVYGVGRDEATRLIKSGNLYCVERRCRGGRIGVFIPVEEAERRFAGTQL